jgi:Tfp pilus assembly protein PilO
MRAYNLYAIFFILTAFLILNFLVLPQYQNWQTVSQRIGEIEKEAQSRSEYFQQIQKIAQDLKRNSLNLKKIENALPQNPSLPQLFYFIQKVNTETGLSFQKIGKIETKENPQTKIKETSVDIVLTGDYSALKNFLSKIETSARLIEVEKISFAFSKKEEVKKEEEKKKEKKEEEKKESPAFDFNLRIKVHHY